MLNYSLYLLYTKNIKYRKNVISEAAYCDTGAAPGH